VPAAARFTRTTWSIAIWSHDDLRINPPASGHIVFEAHHAACLCLVVRSCVLAGRGRCARRSTTGHHRVHGPSAVRVERGVREARTDAARAHVAGGASVALRGA